MPGMQLIISTFLKNVASESRSTVLKPLDRVLSMLLPVIIVLVFIKAPEWMTITLTVILVLAILLYFGSYVFCLRTDKDALRTESHPIQGITPEKGLVGDNEAGQMKAEVSDKIETRLIRSKPSIDSEDER